MYISAWNAARRVLVTTVAAGTLLTVVGLATACSSKPPAAGADDPGTVAGFPTDPASSGDPGTTGTPTASTGGDSTGGGTGTQLTACSLVTAQEAAAALGVGSVSTSSSSSGDCLYQSGGNSVILGYTTETDRSQADLILGLGGQKIDGVGDEAVQITQPPMTQVHVWIGDRHLQIVVTKESGDTAGPARALLDKAMARL